MLTEMFSYEKAREIIKPLQFKTVVEYSKWVEDNNYTHFLPLNPQNYFHPSFQGWEFLGFACLQDYKDAVTKARIANTNYAESAKKSAISRARNRALRANTTTSTTSNTTANTTVKTTVNTTVTTTQPSQNDFHSTKQMVEFFIKEDVDIKVIINFLAEYSHPKEVYLIFLEHLKSKLPVKI
jgi:hypothetical protein